MKFQIEGYYSKDIF